MKLLLLVFLFGPLAFAQGGSNPSLSPFRNAAHRAFTEEMTHDDQPLCPGIVPPSEFAACINAVLKQSDNHLVAYRFALSASITARQKMLGAQSLDHFESTERMWDLYSVNQLKAAGDMAGGPRLTAFAEEEARIDLIRSHMRMLDRIYYTLLHDDCGGCLVDH